LANGKKKPLIRWIKDRKRKWIGNALRKESQAIERQVLNWNPQGRRKRERPKGHGGERQKRRLEKWERPGKK
jgi:hypothetical protein